MEGGSLNPIAMKYRPALTLISPYRLEVSRNAKTKVMFKESVSGDETLLFKIPRSGLPVSSKTLLVTDSEGGHPAVTFLSSTSTVQDHMSQNDVPRTPIASSLPSCIQPESHSDAVQVVPYEPICERINIKEKEATLSGFVRAKAEPMKEQLTEGLSIEETKESLDDALFQKLDNTVAMVRIDRKNTKDGILEISYVVDGNVKPAYDICYEVRVEDSPALQNEVSHTARAKIRSYVHIENPLPFELTEVEVQLSHRILQDDIMGDFQEGPNFAGQQSEDANEEMDASIYGKFSCLGRNNLSDCSDDALSVEIENIDHNVTNQTPLITQVPSKISLGVKQAARSFLFQGDCLASIEHSTYDMNEHAFVCVYIYNGSRRSFEPGMAYLHNLTKTDVQFDMPFLRVRERRFCCKLRPSLITTKKHSVPLDRRLVSSEIRDGDLILTYSIRSQVWVHVRNKEDRNHNVLITFPGIVNGVPLGGGTAAVFKAAKDVGLDGRGSFLTNAGFGMAQRYRFCVKLERGQQRLVVFTMDMNTNEIIKCKSGLGMHVVSMMGEQGSVSKVILQDMERLVMMRREIEALRLTRDVLEVKMEKTRSFLIGDFPDSFFMENTSEVTSGGGLFEWERYKGTIVETRFLREKLQGDLDEVVENMLKTEHEWEGLVATIAWRMETS